MIERNAGYAKMGKLPFEIDEYKMFAHSQENGFKYDCPDCHGRGYTGMSKDPQGKKSIILCKCLDCKKLLEEGRRRLNTATPIDDNDNYCTPVVEVDADLSVSPIEKDLGEVVEGEIIEGA